MQTPGALPSVWPPAAVYFANHTSEQLDEQNLPTEAGQRCKVLRYIHTDGTHFVYRRGKYPDETGRSEKLYTSWREAYDLGANQYMRWKSKQQKTASARSKAQESYAECSLGGLGHSLVTTADMPGTARQQSTTRSRSQTSQQGLSNQMSPGSWSCGQASAAARHQQASGSRTTASAHAAAWPALPPPPPTSDGCSRLPNATNVLPPSPPHQPVHVPSSRALPAAAAAAAGSLTPPTGYQSGSCRRLNRSTIETANTYGPAVPQVPPQQQIRSSSEAALAPVAAGLPSAPPRHVMSGHKRLHETAALPVSRLLSIPQPPSMRTKQLAGHSQRPAKTVPTAVNSTQSRLTGFRQEPVAAHALPPGMNSRSTSHPMSRSAAAQANITTGSVPGQHPDVAQKHHSSEQHSSHQRILKSSSRWSAANRDGPHLCEGPCYPIYQQQQQMASLPSLAGSGFRAVPLHSCSSDAHEAAGVDGFLQQSVTNQAAMQLNQVPNFMAATDNWQWSDISTPPALQGPTGLHSSLFSRSQSSQQQQQQHMQALGGRWQPPEMVPKVPAVSWTEQVRLNQQAAGRYRPSQYIVSTTAVATNGSRLQSSLSAANRDGPHLSEGPWGSIHQQQQMASPPSLAGSGFRAIPLHSCSSDVQEAAGVGGSLQQSVTDQAAAQPPNFMAATDDWQWSDIAIPPALQEPTGSGFGPFSRSRTPQQQQQQQRPVLGGGWQLPQANFGVPAASWKVPREQVEVDLQAAATYTPSTSAKAGGSHLPFVSNATNRVHVDEGGFLPQFVPDQAGAQPKHVTNFMAGTDDWHPDNVMIPPASQGPVGWDFSLPQCLSVLQQQQQQQQLAEGINGLLPPSLTKQASAQPHYTSGPMAAAGVTSNLSAWQTAVAVARPNQAPAANAAGVRCEPNWDLLIKLCGAERRSPTGQRLLLSADKNIGSGGYGEVLQVKVKLYGQHSLAVITDKNQALQALLQRTSCSCGAVVPGAQQGVFCDASQSSADNCCCSVQMALKVPKLYAKLHVDKKMMYSAAAYKQKTEQDMCTEYRLMDQCQSSGHIIDCYALGALQRAGAQQLCILMELSELGSVEHQYSISLNARRGLDDLPTQKIVRQVAQGITDMHRMASTLHRDIKSSNLLVFGSRQAPIIKICDFGICKELAGVGEYGSTVCGTPGWMPPEQAIQGVGQDWRVDSFPLGLLVLALRAGCPPFWWISYQGLSFEKRARMLEAAFDDAQCAYNNSSSTYTALGVIEKAFVKRCLTADISKRPSPESLLMKDPYLLSNYVGG